MAAKKKQPKRRALEPGTLTDVMNWAFSKTNGDRLSRPLEQLLNLANGLNNQLSKGKKVNREKTAIFNFVDRGLRTGYKVEAPNHRYESVKKLGLDKKYQEELIVLLTDIDTDNAMIHSKKVLNYMLDLIQDNSTVPPPWRA